MPKALRIAAIAAVGGILACCGFLAWSFYYGVDAERTTFSSVVWKERANVYAHGNDPGCVRGGMAIDIVSTNLLHGRLISEVISLLGEPDGKQDSIIHYELGQCSGFGWANSELQVNLSERQQVIDAVILRR